jgi:hypothetical protein
MQQAETREGRNRTLSGGLLWIMQNIGKEFWTVIQIQPEL